MCKSGGSVRGCPLFCAQARVHAPPPLKGNFQYYILKCFYEGWLLSFYYLLSYYIAASPLQGI
jgi:hypothetical protein